MGAEVTGTCLADPGISHRGRGGRTGRSACTAVHGGCCGRGVRAITFRQASVRPVQAAGSGRARPGRGDPLLSGQARPDRFAAAPVGLGQAGLVRGSPSGHDWRWCRVTDDAGAPRSGPGFDTTVSHSARIWNYRLGGKDNFSALLFCLPGLTCQNIASSCGNVPLADQLWVALTNAHQRSSPDFCLTFRALSGPAASGGVKATGPVSEPSGWQLR
jgi:hypothetical protein